VDRSGLSWPVITAATSVLPSSVISACARNRNRADCPSSSGPLSRCQAQPSGGQRQFLACLWAMIGSLADVRALVVLGILAVQSYGDSPVPSLRLSAATPIEPVNAGSLGTPSSRSGLNRFGFPWIGRPRVVDDLVGGTCMSREGTVH
jgi:hypothetical protein